MRVLFDIVHPADVLFFKRPIEMLHARGDETLVLSRDKDITNDLLAAFGIPYISVSSAGSGVFGLARELVGRDLAVLRHARTFRPDVMVGFGGVAISHVGRLTGIPSVSFYDTDSAKLQNRISTPFISRLYVPESYAGPTPAGRTVRLGGTKDLSFLHPSGFEPDLEKAISAGLEPDRDNFFVRMVAWRANHDVGKAGWGEALLESVVSHLAPLGRVHISSEEPLPARFAEHRYSGPKEFVHHLLAHCRLMLGESATMACESALLGTPSIYAGSDFPTYTIEMEKAGLVVNVPKPTETTLLAAIDARLSEDRSQMLAARDAYVASCPDWAVAVVDALDAEAKGQPGWRG